MTPLLPIDARKANASGTPPVFASTPQAVDTSCRMVRLGELTSATVPMSPMTPATAAEIAASSRLVTKSCR